MSGAFQRSEYTKILTDGKKTPKDSLLSYLKKKIKLSQIFAVYTIAKTFEKVNLNAPLYNPYKSCSHILSGDGKAFDVALCLFFKSLRLCLYMYLYDMVSAVALCLRDSPMISKLN